MKKALKIISKKGLGVLIIKNNKNLTSGILTDGDLKRLSQKNQDYHSLKIKNVMKKNPITIDKNMLAVKALSIMNGKKNNKLMCTFKKKKKEQLVLFIYIIF